MGGVIIQTDLFDPFRCSYMDETGNYLGYSIKSGNTYLVTRFDGHTRECKPEQVKAFLTFEKPILTQISLNL